MYVWAVTRPEHGQLGFLCLDWSMSCIDDFAFLNREWIVAVVLTTSRIRPFEVEPVASVFAQQDQRIDRKRALRGNPRRHQTQQGHRRHHAG